MAAIIPNYVLRPLDRLDEMCLEPPNGNGTNLRLPSPAFRAELLNSHIFWVHPQVPILNFACFLSGIGERDDGPVISSLLVHAVLFAGLSFVDSTHIHQEGNTSRTAARDRVTASRVALDRCIKGRITVTVWTRHISISPGPGE